VAHGRGGRITPRYAIGPLEGESWQAEKGEGPLDTSNGKVEAMPMTAEPQGYERSRLNAVRHGILSRHLVLPWEDHSE
jgi:hypothetical protein